MLDTANYLRSSLRGRSKYILVLLTVAGFLVVLHYVTTSENPACTPKVSDEIAPVAAPEDGDTEPKGAERMSSTVAVSTASFDREVLQSKEPVLVDFWAPWCAPCRMVAPILDQLAADYAGKVKIVKVNTDENQQLAARYSIYGIPTLILFKGGEPVDRAVGVESKNVLAARLDKALEH